MSRLKVHGKELLRIVHEREIPNDPSRLINWKRITRTYHSDGKVLLKHDVRFIPSPNSFGGSDFHSYGWKVHGQAKKGISMYEHIAKVIAGIEAKGATSLWKIVKPKKGLPC